MNKTDNLQTENTYLKQKISILEEENLALKAKNEYYEEQYKLMQKRRYAPKSEKTIENQLTLFDDMLNEAEAQSDLKNKEPELEEIKYIRKKKRTKDELAADLEVEEIHYEIEEDKLVCDKCNNILHDIGTIKRDEVEIIPAKAIIKRHITHKYACRNCQSNDTEVNIVKAVSPNPLMKGSMATSSAVSHIITQKYMNAVPLYRQEKYLNSLGVSLSRQTMSNWIIKSSKYLEHIYNRMHEVLITSDIVNADETPVQVLKEANRKASQKSYMWLYKGSPWNNTIVLYDYQPSRSYENPKKFLRGFKGYLQTDGYAAYGKLKNIIHLVCMAHIRRKFNDALKILPEEARKESKTKEGFDYCNRLYAIEKKLENLQPEERYEKRLEFSKPIFEEFELWIKEQLKVSLPKSAYGKAIIYANNQLYKVKNYLLDGRLEIDNNTAERSIKPFVIGRKNWLFSNTANGARASAIIYSIVETAKENNLRVHVYLDFLFETLKDMETYNKESLDQLMPWADSIPEKCRLKK